MSENALDLDLKELGCAEEFLEYFGIRYDPDMVQVNRLHILQRFHDYLARSDAGAGDEAARREAHRDLLARAYADFVTSDARTEKVFRVFRMHEPQEAVVSLDDLRAKLRGRDAGAV